MTTDLNIENNRNVNYKCLIHLDRLSITFRHWSGATYQDIRNPDYIPNEQVYNNITLMHDNSPGLGAFYHSYKVLYKGHYVGRLHTATKLKKHELQFEFSKEVFYTFYPEYWFEVYNSIKNELGILYNNIRYLEISIDTNKALVRQFADFYIKTINNELRSGDRYKMQKRVMVHVMNNGSSFVINGRENEIAIYNKSQYTEDFINNYFLNNGLAREEVNRIEARLSWNYIRYLRNKKGFDINVETLKDQKLLAKIFLISTANKITFYDKRMKTIDRNRNSHYSAKSVIDDLPIETAEIGKLNQELHTKHYQSDSIDENILRQNYYRFLETANPEYFRILKANGSVAGYNRNQMVGLINKFNSRYKGNRTIEITKRMNYALKNLSGRSSFKLNGLFASIALKLKWNLLGMLHGMD